MKLAAYGEMIICKEAKTQKGAFTLTEQNKAEVMSVGNKVEDVEIGDMIFYQVNKTQPVGEFFIIHMNSVMCKVIE